MKKMFMAAVATAAGIIGLNQRSSAAPPTGDTQGTVSAVRLKPVSNGWSAFEVWFSSTSNDRWGCIQNDGYVVVSESGTAMNAENFKKLFAIALAAQASGKVLALDSAGTNPCVNVNIGWMLD